MKNIICKKTGSVTFIPETEVERQLLFHLMDCSDLTQFGQYLHNYPNIANCPTATDLDVPAEELVDYPAIILNNYTEATELPYSPEQPVSLYTGETIGFDRNSSWDGKVTDEMVFAQKQRESVRG